MSGGEASRLFTVGIDGQSDRACFAGVIVRASRSCDVPLSIRSVACSAPSMFAFDNTGSALDTIAHIIQVALTPVFLLSGIATLLNVFATRLARVGDKVEAVTKALDDADDEQQRVLQTLLKPSSPRSAPSSPSRSRCFWRAPAYGRRWRIIGDRRQTARSAAEIDG
jgi:hypothetical protein